MTSESITLVCNDYEWLEPIIYGRVAPEGIELNVLSDLEGGERHRRMLAGEFDVAEFSLGTYITGWPDSDFTAIPAFPRRFFPHSRTFVHRSSDLSSPSDLEGKRVLVWTYQNTLALWARGIYAEHYDLDLNRVKWRVLREEPIPVARPNTHEYVDGGSRPEDLLEEGDVDAVISPYTKPMHTSENIREIFEDLEAAESTYFEETGFYPLMHTMVIRNEIIDAHPWLPTELMKTFKTAVDVFEERAQYEGKYPLVWWHSYLQRERELFGDIWKRSFEFGANEEELQTLIRYADEQGLIDEPFDADEMFVTDDDVFQ